MRCFASGWMCTGRVKADDEDGDEESNLLADGIEGAGYELTDENSRICIGCAEWSSVR